MLASLGAYSTFREVEAPEATPVEIVHTETALSETAVIEIDDAASSVAPATADQPVETPAVVAKPAESEAAEMVVNAPIDAAPRDEKQMDPPVPDAVPLPIAKSQLATLPEPAAPPRVDVIHPAETTKDDASKGAAVAAETPVLRAAIQAANRTGYAPFEIDFTARGNFEEVEWDFGPYGKSADASTRVTFDEPGIYTVSLYGFAHGDMVSDMVTIEVHEGSNLLVPDSFTPNGDGINDTYKAEGVNLESFRMTIVDARGKVVFETRNIEEPWVYQGPPVREMDAHFAIIQARGIDGKDYNIHKRINIIF